MCPWRIAENTADNEDVLNLWEMDSITFCFLIHELPPPLCTLALEISCGRLIPLLLGSTNQEQTTGLGSIINSHAPAMLRNPRLQTCWCLFSSLAVQPWDSMYFSSCSSFQSSYRQVRWWLIARACHLEVYLAGQTRPWIHKADVNSFTRTIMGQNRKQTIPLPLHPLPGAVPFCFTLTSCLGMPW